jgi:hypothetical protein
VQLHEPAQNATSDALRNPGSGANHRGHKGCCRPRVAFRGSLWRGEILRNAAVAVAGDQRLQVFAFLHRLRVAEAQRFGRGFDCGLCPAGKRRKETWDGLSACCKAGKRLRRKAARAPLLARRLI